MLAGKVEAACLAQRGATIERMAQALVTTYCNAKTERPEVTRALYRSVAELDNAALIETFAGRVDAATAAMLATATDAAFDDPPTVVLTLLSTIFGTVRNLFERNLPKRGGTRRARAAVVDVQLLPEGGQVEPLSSRRVRSGHALRRHGRTMWRGRSLPSRCKHGRNEHGVRVDVA